MLVVVCPLSDWMLILALPLSGSNGHGVKMVTLSSAKGADPEDWAIPSSGLAHCEQQVIARGVGPIEQQVQVCVCERERERERVRESARVDVGSCLAVGSCLGCGFVLTPSKIAVGTV
jgi:hypothetical protein